MNSGIHYFKEEALNISAHFPTLKYVENEQGFPYISGELVLKDKQALYLDSYYIRIEPASNYPYMFPHVFETQGRIPINIDWHMFPDGHCCIKSVPEEELICKQAINLSWFIEQQVLPYFFNQKYREMHGYFLHERAHGMKGIIEFFEETFKTENLTAIAQYLLFIKKRSEPDRTNNCFCGSGSKYRKCHKEAFRLLSKLTNEELEKYTCIVSIMKNLSI